MDGLRWRAMVPRDLGAVTALATALFPDHYEDPARFAERLRASPSLCYTLSGKAETILGYLVAYPWPLGTIPPLNRPLPGSLPAPDAVYLHDLGLHPEAVGRGHARAGIGRLLAQSRELGTRSIALVAVNGSVAFWQAHDFLVAEHDPALARTLESYGADARYMVRRLMKSQALG